MNPDRVLVALGAVIVGLSPFAHDAMLVGACGVVLALVGGVLLRPGAPPVFALVLGYQWAQVSAATLYGNAIGASLEALYPTGDVVRATAYGLLALVVATVVAGWAAARWPVPLSSLAASLRALSIARLAQGYALALLLGLPLERLVGVTGQAAQLVQALGDLRWALMFLLVAAALLQRRGTPLAAAVVLGEVVIGLSGFFAGFAEPLMLALLAFVAVFTLLRPHQRLAAGALALALLALGVVWQGLKNEYRREVSGGSGQQVVVVGLGERYALLGRMAGETVDDDLSRTVEKFALRLAYVQNFGLVLRRVPAELPHREGGLLGAAVAHVLVPRVVFPDKPPLPSDSALTAEYTGNVYILYMTGTSISLGYLTELYIDFGVAGVLLAGLLLGGIMVLVHLAFRRASPDPALALALATGVLMQARAFETALPKLLGGVLAPLLVQIALLWLLRGWIMPLLRDDAPAAGAAAARGRLR